jgi:hypothetical protein
MTTFYDNINDYFDKDVIIKNNIAKPNIYNFQSQIIKEYTDMLEGSTGEYFEDRVMNAFNEYFNRCENEDIYDDICNNIIFIYYKSIVELKEYYSNIYKKNRFYLL